MKLNLDALKNEILEYLDKEGFVVFHGFCRNTDSRPAAYWDTGRAPEFRTFLTAARQGGAKLIVFNPVDFLAATVDDALGRLEEYEPPLEERRKFERRLREMRAYQGFTCALELAFDHESRTYIYELQADWYLDFLHILDEIESYAPEGEERTEEDSMGGYYSRN